MKDIKFTPKMKAVMELLIHEISQCKTLDEVRNVTDSWISANGLHPEQVETIEEADFQSMLSRFKKEAGK